eukprot:RCo034112
MAWLCSCPFPKCHCLPRRRFQLPIWVLLMGLSTISVVLIGTVTFRLTMVWGVNTVKPIAEEYRELACNIVQDEAVGFMWQLIDSTRQLSMYAGNPENGPENPAPADVRKIMLTRVLSIRKSMVLNVTATSFGLGSGELLALVADAETGKLFWSVSNNATGYQQTMWPATVRGCKGCSDAEQGLWEDSNWRQRINESVVVPGHYNVTEKTWFRDALHGKVAGNSGAVMGEIFVGKVPSGGRYKTTLEMPVIVPIRRQGAVVAAVGTFFDLLRVEGLLKTLSTLMFPGTVIFLVDGFTGHLLASSAIGASPLQPPDSPSGMWTPINATEANDTAVR